MVYKREGSSRWTANYKRIPDGKWRTKSFANKSLAKKFEADERLKWERFLAGTYEESDDHVKTPMAEHVKDFFVAMEVGSLSRGKGAPSTAYVTGQKARMDTMVRHMRLRVLSDVTMGRLDRFILDLKEGHVERASNGELIPPASASSQDDYGNLLAQFARWAVRRRRLKANPLQDWRPRKRKGEERVRRRSLHLPDLQRLIEAAEVRELQLRRPRTEESALPYRRRGACRAISYWIAGLTGLRATEVRRLTWSQLQLEGEMPFLQVRAKDAKDSQDPRLPLLQMLVDRLVAWRTELVGFLGRPVAESDLVVPWMPCARNLADALRADAEFAGIATSDAEGRKLDFHALRGSCATILFDLGIKPHIVQRLMRHSSIELTMKHYVNLSEEDLHSALRRVPAGSSSNSRPGDDLRLTERKESGS